MLVGRVLAVVAGARLEGRVGWLRRLGHVQRLVLIIGFRHWDDLV